MKPSATVAGNQQGGLHLELIDMEQLYESVADRVTLINHFDVRDSQDMERLNQLLYTEYKDDILDNTPTCDCGTLRGEYNIDMRCTQCGTIVQPTTEQPIESKLWMKVPEGVHAFILPQAWSILNTVFRRANVRMIKWLTDPTYSVKNLSRNGQQIIDVFEQIGWKRSINYFYEHFDQAIELLLEHCAWQPVKRKEIVRQFIEENRHKIFTSYLPIPNRLIFIVEKTSMGTYADEVMRSALDAVRTISSIESKLAYTTDRKRQNRTVKVTEQLADYYLNYMKSNIGGKPGMFRHQVFGSRLDFSGRAVISSMTYPHRYDEIHLPWGLSVMMMKLHITNKLLRRGMTPTEAESFLMLHTQHYHPTLDEIFQELIAESPNRGIGVLFQRNPSLQRGSAQMLYVTKIKTDPKINTTSFSCLCLASPNADFDSSSLSLPSEMVVE